MRIESPGDDEVWSTGLLRFSTAGNIPSKGIHHRMIAVYGNKVMDESLLRRWAWEFNTNRETVYDCKRSGQWSLITQELENVSATSMQMIGASSKPDYHPFCKISRVFGSITLHKKR